MKIDIYYHLWAAEDGALIRFMIDEQMKRLSKSGLLKNGTLHVGILGDHHDIMRQHMHTYTERGWEFDVLYNKPNTEYAECETMEYIHKHSVEWGDDNHMVMYMHTKGLSHFLNHSCIQPINTWRHFCEYCVIDKWKDCVNELKNNSFDTIGPNYSTNVFPHYSGTFWWARSDYLKTHVAPMLHAEDQPINNWWFSKRHRAESWVMSSGTGQHKNQGNMSGDFHYFDDDWENVLKMMK